MNENKVVVLRQKDEIDDPLTEILRSGAQTADRAGGGSGVRNVSCRTMRTRCCRMAGSASFATDMIRFARSRPGSGRSRCRSPRPAIAARRAKRAHSLHLGDPAEMGAANEEPRRAAAGALSARHFGRRFPGGSGGVARQGRAQPLAVGHLAAEGRVGRRISALAKAGSVGAPLCLSSGPTASISRRAWSRRPNACWS